MTLSGHRLRHTVAFRLRHGEGSPEWSSFLAAPGGPGAIEGVEAFEVVREVSAT